MRTHLRRVVAICATVAVATTMVFIAAAGAAVGDGILGGTPTEQVSSTMCPPGTFMTGAAVTGDFSALYSYVNSMTAQCSDGTVGNTMGTVDPSGNGTTACGPGNVAVGIAGFETDGSVAQLSMRCRTSNLTGATSGVTGVGFAVAGVRDGPYDCPDGEALTGLTGSLTASSGIDGGAPRVRELEIKCGSPAVSLPTIVISGSAPDGVVGVPYDFGYTASGDSGITLSVLGSLPPGLTFDPTLQTLGGTPTTAGVYTFVVRATGASGASTDLDESVTIVAPPPAVGLSPTGVAFGDQPVGATSTAHTVTITNTAASGAESLTLGQLALGGSNSDDFSLSSDTCSNTSVAAGSSCTVAVSFTPTATGSRGASLSIPSNAGSSPDAVALSGTGAPVGADVKLSISGPTTAASGSQNTYVVTVSNLGPATATGVVMTVQVPNGTKFVGVSTTQGSCTHPASGATSGTISCSLGNLTSGAAAADSVTLKLSLSGKGGTIALVASASASTPDPDLSNNVASLATTAKKK
jgi:uncharacterized repeat protein (TIGR01451 family)